MKIKPLHDGVVVRRNDADLKTAGGIVLPDSAAEGPVEGTVVAVGPGKILENGVIRTPDVKVGDKILFGRYSGVEVKVDGDELLVMHEADIMGVVGLGTGADTVVVAEAFGHAGPLRMPGMHDDASMEGVTGDESTSVDGGTHGAGGGADD